MPGPAPSPMRGRRGARRLAVQALYRRQIADGEANAIVAEFLAERGAAIVDRDYFREIVTAAVNDAAALDELLAACLDRRLDTLDPVEHAILLCGAVELRDRRELAVSIIVNEAVELAKTFGAEGGHRYVNAVLDKLALRLRADESRTGKGGG